MLEQLSRGGSLVSPADAVSDLPGPPGNLAAIASADDALALAWSPAAGARAYNVYRAPATVGGYARVNATPLTGTSYGDAGLSPETKYSYWVTALGAAGEGRPSDPVSIRTGAAPPPCEPFFADNVTHTLQGRAYALFGFTYARGSGDPMGWWNILTETHLHRDGAGYRVGTCPAP